MVCTFEGKTYNEGDIICVNGRRQICADDGTWTQTNDQCDGTEKNAPPEETLDTTIREGKVPKPVTEQTDDKVLTAEQQKRTDKVRAGVTFWLLGIFTLVLILAGVVSAVPRSSWTQVKEFMNVALPAVIGLLGSAVGFYFGSRTGEATRR